MSGHTATELIERCAKIAEPWPGFWLDDNSTDVDRAVVAVRTEIAEKIRALSPSAQGDGSKRIEIDIGAAAQVLQDSPELCAMMSEMVGGPALVEAQAEIERLSDSHAELVKALEEIRGGHFKGAGTLAVNGDWKTIVENLQAIARAALATLTARKVG